MKLDQETYNKNAYARDLDIANDKLRRDNEIFSNNVTNILKYKNGVVNINNSIGDDFLGFEYDHIMFQDNNSVYYENKFGNIFKVFKSQ